VASRQVAHLRRSGVLVCEIAREERDLHGLAWPHGQPPVGGGGDGHVRRYTHLLTWGELVEFSRLGEGAGPPPTEAAEFKKRYNQAPTELAPVVRIESGRRELVMLRWGGAR
jgi:hypothetical protein